MKMVIDHFPRLWRASTNSENSLAEVEVNKLNSKTKSKRLKDIHLSVERPERALFAHQRQSFLMLIFLTFCFDSAVFGSTTFRTPFLNVASVLSLSIEQGNGMRLWNEP